MPNDEVSMAEERRLRGQLTALTRKREQRYAEWDRLLAADERERDTALASQEAALTAKVAELSQQMAATLAELDEGPDEPPAQPPLPGQRSLGPDDIAREIKDGPAALVPAWQGRGRHVGDPRAAYAVVVASREAAHLAKVERQIADQVAALRTIAGGGCAPRVRRGARGRRMTAVPR